MNCLRVVALAGVIAATGQAADQVAKESGDWNSIIWSPGAFPGAADIVHIEGGFSVNYTGGSSQNLSRIFVGDSTGGFTSPDGSLEVSGGVLTVNANAAAAFVIGLSDNSKGKLLISGGRLRGVGSANGAGMQIGVGANSTGSVIVSEGELQLASGVVVGYGDHSTGHFEVTDGAVTVANNADGHAFSICGRTPGASSTGTYLQTGGSVAILHNTFRVGYAGGSDQSMDASAKILGGNFTGNVQVGRQSSLRTGGGAGGTLTIGADAEVQGRDLAWEVSGNGTITFVLGPTGKFNAVDLTSVSADNALTFTQQGARLAVDGTNLKYSIMPKPVTLIRFADGKGPTDTSKSYLDFEFTGFDSRLSPELVWTGTSLQLEFARR